VKEGDEVVGNETRVKVVKNKVAPPFRQTEFQIMYGKGIHRTGEIIELGVKQGLIEKSGAWYSHGTDRIGQGRKNAAEFLDSHPETKASIEASIRQQLMPLDNPTDESAVAAGDESLPGGDKVADVTIGDATAKDSGATTTAKSTKGAAAKSKPAKAS